MLQSTASVDETRMDYILAAVDSARKAFPCHVTKRKHDNQAGSGPKAAFDRSDVDSPVNDHLGEWTEKHISDVNGFVEVKVT